MDPEFRIKQQSESTIPPRTTKLNGRDTLGVGRGIYASQRPVSNRRRQSDDDLDIRRFWIIRNTSLGSMDDEFEGEVS